MYKKAADSQHFIPRKGSHSTKGSRGGRVVTLPPEAQPHEVAYLEMNEQLQVLDERRNQLAKQRQLLELRLKAPRLTELVRQQLRDEGKALQDEFKKLKSERNKIRKTMKYAGLLPYCIVFYYLAEKRLDNVLFKELDAETTRMMGRSVDQFTLNYYAATSSK